MGQPVVHFEVDPEADIIGLVRAAGGLTANTRVRTQELRKEAFVLASKPSATSLSANET